ncbi:tetratricopeptide repeat protein [Leptospira santarosai]|uniref:tetratricopeptide repeat protein n=1 Tax=Leptospira santarosai TaxID=28183 RepID=UPI0007740D63|nr:tetratricopeptide repeat protein [Leptospira santarosai]MDI7204116.1 tetratricopeptide repeat protein [Leptospira santarosai]
MNHEKQKIETTLKEIFDNFITESEIKFVDWDNPRSSDRPFKSERIFYNEAVQYSEFHPSILKYVNKIIEQNLQSSILWSCEEEHAGTHAIMALALFDKKYIKDYVNFLRSNDLDHEVYQNDDIEELIRKWGWCQETLSLAAARCFRGQFGTDQFHEMMDVGLREYLALPDKKDFFLLKLCEEIKGEMWYKELDVPTLVSHISDIFEDLDLRYPAKKIQILAKEIASAKKNHQIRSENVLDRVKQGWEHIQKQEYSLAEELVRSALAEYPQDAQALFLDARLCWLSSGSIEAGIQRAQENLTKATKFDSRPIAQLHNLIGCGFDLLARNKEAVQVFEQAVKVNPKEPIYLANLAEMYWKIGDKPSAVKYAQKAQSLGKKSEIIETILKEA